MFTFILTYIIIMIIIVIIIIIIIITFKKCVVKVRTKNSKHNNC